MDIIDLTQHHTTQGSQATDYFKSRPQFFEHYFRYWADKSKPIIKLSPEDIRYRRALVSQEIIEAIAALEKLGLPTSRVSPLLFIGNDSANGHALLEGDQGLAWYALETFDTQPKARVFVLHELAHAVHYLVNSEFFFRNEDELYSMWRQLVVEGIATYLTKSVFALPSSTALWADYLPEDKLNSWMDECDRRKSELYNYCFKIFDSSDPNNDLFHASNKNDIFKYRSGYYVALNVIEQIVREHSLSLTELIRLPSSNIKPMIRTALQNKISA